MSATAPASARYREGLAVRRSVLGDAHVDRAEAAASDFDRPFQQLITEAAWGTVWSRPAWSKRALDGDAGAAGGSRPRRGGGDACARHRQHRRHSEAGAASLAENYVGLPY